mmetsp:Transcript_25034/g.54442  ORF Transcript_25034/g.54442 Transcript_25034/m.54442 type:complete len:86 (-) Transcript_25034:1401-1658(-)
MINVTSMALFIEKCLLVDVAAGPGAHVRAMVEMSFLVIVAAHVNTLSVPFMIVDTCMVLPGVLGFCCILSLCCSQDIVAWLSISS